MPSRIRALLPAATLVAAVVTAPAHATPSWTPPIVLDTPAGGAVDIAVTGQGPGAALAVWLDAVAPGTQRLRAAVRSNGTTSAPITLTTEPVKPFEAAATAGGRAAVIGLRGTGATSDMVALSSETPGSWSSVTTLDTSVVQGQVPDLAMNANGTAAAVWTKFTGAKTEAFAAVQQPGQPWGPATKISAMGADVAFPHVAVLPDGRVVAVLQQDAGGTTHLVAAIRDPAGTWSAPANVTPGEVAHYDNPLAAGSGGDAMVLWYDPEVMGDQALRAARLTGSTWGAAETVRSGPTTTGHNTALTLDADGRATAFASTPGGGTLDLVQRAGDGTWSVLDTTANAASGGTVVAGGGSVAGVWLEPGDMTVHGGPFAGGALGDTPLAKNPQALSVGVDGAGDALVGVASGMALSDLVPTLRVLDGTPPAVDATVPASAVAGQAVALSASASDAWSSVSPVSWSFGDGAAATGDAVSHAWAAPGTYTVTATGADVLGNAASVTRTVVVTAAPVPLPPPGAGGTGTPTPPVDRTAPTVRGLKVLRGGRALKATLSEAATLRVTLQRRVGKRWKRVGKVRSIKAKRGTHTLRLFGTLPRGRYRLSIVARDAAGNTSRRSAYVVFRR